jgi:hypothetical protein
VTACEILSCASAYREHSGKWPTKHPGDIHGTLGLKAEMAVTEVSRRTDDMQEAIDEL